MIVSCCLKLGPYFISSDQQPICTDHLNVSATQAYAESHGIIFNGNKTVCTTSKAKSAKSTAIPLLNLGGQYVKSVDQYKYRVTQKTVIT